MSLPLRVALIVGAVLLLALILIGIRRSRMRIEDSIFWIILALFIFILSIFPDIGISAASLLGVVSPVNFVLLFFIAVLIAKCFSLARQVSMLETKFKELTQHIAIDKLAHYERYSQKDTSIEHDSDEAQIEC